MQVPRGMIFLQLSSAVLIIATTTLYQNRSTLAPQRTSLARQCAIYQRYESALMLLEANRPISATELLVSFSDTELSITNGLLGESALTHCPGSLFLRLGVLLSQRASQAAQGGAAHQA